MLIALEGEELVEAGHMAEDVFVRQMKRRRAILGLSQADLAERVVALGGSMYQQTIAKIESGQRAVRLAEADVLASALNSTVPEMLSSAFSGADEALRKPPTEQDFKAELAAVEGRLMDATHRTAETAEILANAHRAFIQAQMENAAARAQHEELVRQRTDLLAALAVARGEPLGATIGRILQRARFDAGMSVDELSSATTVRMPIIHAIEQDDFSRCGGDVYVRGHIRHLARALGLDPEPLVERYVVEHGGRLPSDSAAPLHETKKAPPRHGTTPRRKPSKEQGAAEQAARENAVRSKRYGTPNKRQDGE